MPPSPSPRASHDDGFTIVEVLIAVLLLAVVASGVALAVASTVHMSVVSNANERQQAAAKRVFEYLRANRGWMSACPKAGDSCTPAIPASVLEDRGLTDCGGGTYTFKLGKLWAKAIHSTSNSTTAKDLDDTTVDFYEVHVEVGSPASLGGADPCNDALRLGLPKVPSVYESAMDQKGSIPHGSLTVEICRWVNQHDDRADVGGCRSPYVALKERPCPNYAPSYWDNYDSPFKTCDKVLGLTSWLKDPPTTSGTPSIYLWGQRQPLSFTVTGPGGSFSSAGAAVPGQPGTFHFNDLPSGTYNINLGGVPANYEVWKRKAVPAVDSGGNLVAVVQPDMSSRAMVPLRPKRQGMFGIHFTRAVGKYHTEKETKEGTDEKIPTDKFELNKSGFAALADCKKDFYLYSAGPNGENVGTTPGASSVDGVAWDHDVYELCDYTGTTDLSPNCVHGWQKDSMDDGATWGKPWGPIVCTYYDFWVRLTYYRGVYDGTENWGGAMVDAEYTVGAMPTGRDLEDDSTQFYMPSLKVQSAVGDNLSPAASTKYFSKPLAAGLNSGVYALNGSANETNKYGDVSSVSSNEGITPLPQALHDAIWVHPDGGFETPDGSSYAKNHVFTVVGKGECYWNGGTQGPCDKCHPVIAGLGWFGDCYVLTKIEWKKTIRCFGGLDTEGTFTSGVPSDLVEGLWCDAFNQPDPKSGTDPGTALCSTVPQIGDHTKVAPNCYTVPPPPPPCQGGCSGGGSLSNFSKIPDTWHETGGGAAHAPGALAPGS